MSRDNLEQRTVVLWKEINSAAPLPPLTSDFRCALVCRMQKIREWRQGRRLLARLGSAQREERDAAESALMEMGEAGVPLLHAGLRGSPATVCGAAVVLARQQRLEGVWVALRRCYEEEWLQLYLTSGHLGGLRALRRLGCESVGEVLRAALLAAGEERSLYNGITQLTVAISALRLFALFDGPMPPDWWEHALHYGRSQPRYLQEPYPRILIFPLTDRIRAAGIRGLLREYPLAGGEVLTDALHSPDFSVGQTALDGLCRLGDRRALPAIQQIAFAPGHPLAASARRAVERLDGAQADSLLLLRTADPILDELLIPALPAKLPEEERLVRAL